MDKRRIEKFRWMLGLTNMVFKECDGRSGGLVLFWRSGVDATLRDISKYYIDVEIAGMNGVPWRFTGIFCESHADKEYTWDALRNLNSGRSDPWLCSRDFIEILFSHEKQGGAAQPHGSMHKFQLALEDCGPVDLGYKGDTFTWRNHSHKKGKYIRERLDRAVANSHGGVCSR
jgi:hypothetical protein